MNTLQPATGYVAAFYPIFASESPLGATCLHCKEVVPSNKLMLYDDKNQTDDFKLLACSFSCIDALEIEQERRLEQKRRIEQYLLTECFCRPWTNDHCIACNGGFNFDKAIAETMAQGA